MKSGLWLTLIVIIVFLLAQPNLTLTQDNPPEPASREVATEPNRPEAAGTNEELQNAQVRRILEIADRTLTLSQNTVSGIASIVGITAGIGALFGFLGIKYGWSYASWKIGMKIKEGIKETQEKIINDTKSEIAQVTSSVQETQRVVAMDEARFQLRLGYMAWAMAKVAGDDQGKLLLSAAIRDTESAVRLEPQDEVLAAEAKSNLAYYYAELQMTEKKDEALTYAAGAASLAQKYPAKGSSWLVNECFVKLRFATTKDELRTIKAQLEKLKAERPELSDEVNQYLSEIAKTGGLNGGPFGTGPGEG